MKTIFIPKQYTFVDQVPEFKEDVPDNVYIDKTTTGCGFTTAILKNDVNYVITVPFIALATNKCDQAKNNPEYPHEIFAVYGETDMDLLEEYLKDESVTVKKIIVTYDSLKKLNSYIDPKQFKLFIDEAHKILEYAGNFKPKVIQYLISCINLYKAYVLTTATPTKEEYLPVELKDIEKIKLIWENVVPISFNHKRLNQNQLPSTVLSICLSHLRNEAEGNIYIFYNSVKAITRIIKTLVKTYKYTYKDIDVICANTPSNKKTLKSLGTGWQPAKPIKFDRKGNEITTYKKVTFVTSTSFEGVDFKDPLGKTLIISDGKLEHTKLDISTQMSQIIGRLRNSIYKDVVNLLWTYSPINQYETIEDYKIHVGQLSNDADSYLVDYSSVQTNRAKESLIAGVEKDIFFIDDSERDEEETISLALIKNPNAINHLLNNFEALDLVYSVSIVENSFENTLEDKITYTAKNIFTGKVTCNLNPPSLSPKDKQLIGHCANFSKVAEQYVKTLIRLASDKSLLLEDNEELKEELEEFVTNVETDQHFEPLLEYIEVFGIKSLSEHSYRADKINKRLEEHRILKELPDILRRELNLKIESTYTKKELKEVLQVIYDKYEISTKASATKIKLLFLTKDTKNTDGENCFKIIKKL